MRQRERQRESQRESQRERQRERQKKRQTDTDGKKEIMYNYYMEKIRVPESS